MEIETFATFRGQNVRGR